MAGYVLGNLSPEEAEEFARLLAAHPDQATEVKALQSVLTVMAEELTAVEPPIHLKTALLESAQTGQAAISEPPSALVPRSRPTSRRWLQLGSGIAALLAIAFVIENQRLRQQLQSAQTTISGLQQELQDMQTTVAQFQSIEPTVILLQGTEQSEAIGSLIAYPNQSEAWITVQNLPELPADQVYRLWAIAASDAPIYYGQFETDNQGNAVTRLAVPPPAVEAETPQFLITREAATDPLIPAGPLVMQSSS